MPTNRRSSKRPYGQPHPELDVERARGATGARRELGPRGEEFLVAIPRPTDKTYMCPGCSKDIDGKTQHVVAWAADGLFGAEIAAEQRRHWHTGCWNSFGRHRG